MVGYGVQLREKQKVKRIYGVLEDQFRRYFEQAERTRRHHRRDAAAAARAPARQRRLPHGLRRPRAPQARQLVRHGHFLVNGKKVDIPSYSLKAGDVVAVRESSRAERRPSSTPSKK